jgi:hypothetical protein
VNTGDQFEVEVIDGRIVLRPLKLAAETARSNAADELSPTAVQSEPTPTLTASPEVKRGPGRPRKAAASSPATSPVLPLHLKARGAKRKAPAADETPP